MSELSTIFNLLTNATWVVKLTLLVLIILSTLSWGLIGQKIIRLYRAHRDNRTFEQQFWSGADIRQLHQSCANQPTNSITQIIFCAGWEEFVKITSHSNDKHHPIDNTRRAMKAAAQREISQLESRNAFLATVGSVSPYIGLFGTVWGIMHAFIGLGHSTQATLQAVAPGIAEALIATAMGLFAAIPAVIGYNRLTADMDQLVTETDTFIEEFSNILQRKQPHSN